MTDLEKLYKIYPALNTINKVNQETVQESILFRKMDADQYLKESGQRCSGFLFIMSGQINIKKINEEGEETNLYDIGKGDFCHEALSCFLNYEPLNITARAVQDSYIALIPVEIVSKYLLVDTQFLQAIYKDLYFKFKRIVENKEENIHESIENRLIKLLLSKNTKTIYTTHSQLAFELDSAREVVSRKLKRLKEEGYIDMARGKIVVIKDLTKIKELL